MCCYAYRFQQRETELHLKYFQYNSPISPKTAKQDIITKLCKIRRSVSSSLYHKENGTYDELAVLAHPPCPSTECNLMRW